jgi:hypothetical protein
MKANDMLTKSIVLSVTTTGKIAPVGRTFGGLRFKLTAPSGNSTDSGATTEVAWTFPGAVIGNTYTWEVAELDTAGVVIGTPTTGTVTVNPDPVGATYQGIGAVSVLVM